MKGLLIILAAALTFALPVAAAPPAKSYITIDQPSPYSYGQTVTFHASGGLAAFIHCYQGRTEVLFGAMALTTIVIYDDDGNVVEAYYTLAAELDLTSDSRAGAGTQWTGGAADCEAQIGYWGSGHFHVNAHVDFHVGG